MELVKEMEERWAAEERWALRQWAQDSSEDDELQELRLLLQSGPPSDRRPMLQNGPSFDERRNLRSIKEDEMRIKLTTPHTFCPVSGVTSWRSSSSSGATSGGATSDGAMRGATRGATSSATSVGHRPLHLLRPVAQKKRHPAATAHGMKAQPRVDDVQLPSPSTSPSPSPSALPVLPGAAGQIPACAGRLDSKRSAVMSASTERRTYATNPLCAPGAEPSPTSIMELMAKLAEAKSGKSPRPAARGDPNMAAARGDPNMAAARGDHAPRPNHEKESFMSVPGTSSAILHNDPKKVTEALKGTSVRVALNQPSLPSPPPPAISPPDSLAHQKGNSPRGYFMRLRKM